MKKNRKLFCNTALRTRKANLMSGYSMRGGIRL